VADGRNRNPFRNRKSEHGHSRPNGARDSVPSKPILAVCSAAPAALISARTSDPGLTAGPGHCRPCGPGLFVARASCKSGRRSLKATPVLLTRVPCLETSACVPAPKTVARPGRQAGIRGSERTSAEVAKVARPGRQAGIGGLRRTRAEGATVARPGRQAGIRGSERPSAEGASRGRFERLTNQASGFAGGH
jgi:hypothetical protein